MQPFSGALREMATIPGARYCCVADGDTGVVLAEQGPDDADPAAAVRWGAHLPGVLRAAGDIEDVMITAERTYHLLRRVRDGARVLLVHVSVDREHGTLAAARRTLGNLDVHRPPTTREPLSPATSVDRGVPATLPVRTPRRPAALPPRAPGAATAPGSPLSAVPPPRSPATGERPGTRSPTARTTAATAPPVRGHTTAPPPPDVPPAPVPAIPEARGWSDDLYTMRRLLDGLRKLS